MKIRFKDFVPELLSQGRLFTPATFESFQGALEKANEWTEQHSDLEVFNVETVVLPNIHATREEGSEDVSLLQSSEGIASWHQFIRVWYRG